MTRRFDLPPLFGDFAVLDDERRTRRIITLRQAIGVIDPGWLRESVLISTVCKKKKEVRNVKSEREDCGEQCIIRIIKDLLLTHQMLRKEYRHH